MKKLLIYTYLVFEFITLYFIFAGCFYMLKKELEPNNTSIVLIFFVLMAFFITIWLGLSFRTRKLIYKYSYPNIKRQIEILENYLKHNYNIVTTEIPFITKREILEHTCTRPLYIKKTSDFYYLKNCFASEEDYKSTMRQLIEYHKEKINYFNL